MRMTSDGAHYNGLLDTAYLLHNVVYNPTRKFVSQN